MDGNIAYCLECGLVYYIACGHVCQKDLRERIEKLEKTMECSTTGALISQITELQGDVAQLEVYLDDERKDNKRLRDENIKLLRGIDNVDYSN